MNRLIGVDMDSLTCLIDWCERSVGPRSEYCNGHKERLKNNRDMNMPWRKKRANGEWEFCTFDNCQNKMWAREYCKTHYKQFIKNEPLKQISYRLKFSHCSISACTNSPDAGSGLCVRHWARAKKYSLTNIQLQMLVDSSCAICGTQLDETSLHLDHDHSCCPGKNTCGKCFRGPLCRSCNHGLGNFQDDPGRLNKAIEYLSRQN